VPDVGPNTIPVEPCDVQTELVGVLSEIVVLERLLATEEQLVHGPEAILYCAASAAPPPECVRMDLDDGEMPEGETRRPLGPCSTCSIA